MRSAFDPVTALADLAVARSTEPAIVVDGGEDLDFRQWERRSTAVAAGLVDRGVAPGERVALRFDAGGWASFASCYIGVLKAGALAVLIPGGLAAPDAARVLHHSGALGVLGPPHLARPSRSTWAAEAVELEVEGGLVRTAPAVERSAPAELVYPLAPLCRPRPRLRAARDLAPLPGPVRPGWLVHMWAPGSLAGQLAMAQVLSGTGTALATPASFTPDGFCALVARLGATTCGLTPGLAALLASVGTDGAERSAVRTILHSPGAPRQASLAAALPGAIELDVADVAVPGLDEGADAAPIAASQLGMVWHEQLVPGSFNLPCLVRRHRGALDVGALERALGELLRRHEPLRTSFGLEGGEGRQVVARPAPFELAVTDLSGVAPPEREAEAARLVADASTRPFDLVTDPLFAPGLVRLGLEDHVLIVRVHHTAFDDWSVDVYRRELSALYSAFHAGEPSPLPEPATRFADVSRSQQTRLAGPAGEEQRRHWRARMAGAPLPVQVPLGGSERDGPGPGEPLRHDLPPELSSRVRAMAPVLRATPFMTVLAAFEVLLAQRTGQHDLVLASVVSGRGSTALEPMIGCFTKKVLLRLQLDGDPTFAELVGRTRASVLDALAHQELPFEAVVQETLGAAASEHGLAVQVPVVFQGETPQQARLVLPGLEVGPFDVPASARRERHFSAGGATPQEESVPWGDGAHLGTFLILSLLESGAGLSLIARGVFARPQTRRLLEDLERVLDDLTRAPGRRLSTMLRPGPPPSQDGDELSWRGLRLRRSRLEAALATCPGVAEVEVGLDEAGGKPRLVAYVVPDRIPGPTLAQLRAALWSALPGSPWPAVAFVVDELPRKAAGVAPPASIQLDDPPDPRTALLTALWAESSSREITPSTSYWQDFSFLPALAEARAAGLPITDEQVARCRTPEMLAAALAAAEATPPEPAPPPFRGTHEAPGRPSTAPAGTPPTRPL